MSQESNCAPPLADMVCDLLQGLEYQDWRYDDDWWHDDDALLPDELNSLKRFFAYKAILTNLPELSEIKIDPKSLQFDCIGGVLENKFRYDADYHVSPELSQAVAKAIEAADAFAVTPAPPFTPASFDRRFAGKTFAVKGDDFGAYAPGEIERMITAFGGAVAEEIANGADFVVCGASMGEAFDDALQCGAALLSPEYFEDMTR